MKIWLINPFDPLPIDADFKPLRYGNLVNELLRRGHTVTWISSDFFHFTKEYRNLNTLKTLPAGLQLVLLHTNRYYSNISILRLINYWQYCRQLDRWLKNNPSPDGIVVTYPLIEAALIALEYGSRNNVPVLVDVLDLWPEVYLLAVPKLIRGFFRVLLIREFMKAKRVFVLTNNCAAVSRQYLSYAGSYQPERDFKFSKVYYIGHDLVESLTFEDELFRLRSLGIHSDDLNFTFVGTLGKSYDISCLLDAAKYFESQYPTVKFIIGGEGPMRNRWQLKAQQMNLKNVKFIGFVDSTLFGPLLKHSFAGLMTYAPGALQSIPAKAADYLAYGLPVVSSLVGEFEEMTEQSKIGVSYKAGNVNSLINAIKKLLDSPLFVDDCGRNARELFTQQFSSRSISSRYVDDLERLFNDKTNGI